MSNNLTVKLFAHYRELVGSNEFTLPATESLTMAQVLAEILRSHPALSEDDFAGALLACNQQLVSPEHSVKVGDEVAIMPPVTGG